LQLEDNPYSYNSHVEVVKLLRTQGDLDELRRARESMSAAFPLTEGIFIVNNYNNNNNSDRVHTLLS